MMIDKDELQIKFVACQLNIHGKQTRILKILNKETELPDEPMSVRCINKNNSATA